MKKKLSIALIILALAVIEGYIMYSIGENKRAEILPQEAVAETFKESSVDTQGTGLPSPPAPEEEIPVKTARIEAQNLSRTHTFYGNAAPYAEASVQGKSSGKIIALLLEEGAVVEKGTVMAHLDDSDTQLQLAKAKSEKEAAVQEVKQARANVDTILADVERQKKLFGEGIISRKMFDDAQNQLQGAEAGLNRAYEAVKQTEAQIALSENILKDLTIRAPLSGIVEEKRYNSSEIYQTGDVLYHLVDLHKVYVHIEVPERYISRMAEEMPVEVEFDSLEGQRFSGTIAQILPRSSGQGRNFLVKALVDNPGRRIKPGMFARVDVRLPGTTEAFAIDPKALLEDGEQYYVFKAVGRKAEKVAVDVKLYEENSVAVVSENLRSDDTIVVEGAHLLQPNASLKFEM